MIKPLLDKVKSIIVDKDFSEILSKSFYYILFRVGGTIFGYVFSVFITQTYGANIYGIVALCFSFFLFIGVFGRLGIDTNIVKVFSKPEYRSDVGLFYKAVSKSFLVSLLICFIVYVFGEEIVVDLLVEPKPEILPYLPWVLFSVPLWSIVLISASFFRARSRNNIFAFFNNPGRFLLSLFFLLVLYFFVDKDPIITVQSHFFGILVLALISLFLVYRDFNGIKLKHKSHYWGFLKDAFPMMLASSAIIILSSTDTFLMGVFETTENVGIYNIALKISTLSIFFLQAISSILAPKIAKAYAENDIENFNKIVKFSTKINFYLSSSLIAVIIIFRKFLLNLFGEQFVEGEVILIILCAGQIINAFTGPVGVVMQMIGKQKVFRNIVIIALILNIILTITLIPIYGGIGATISTSISMFVWNISSSAYLRLRKGIKSHFTL
ncbi:lipopolysaccharide biosynthesis protein [Flavobacterium sp. CS20]|uniref:lipopolysaccharide biosynthesis protein n=1 Tax=Flavobacterium sp. CS20 TaxID=2775246 RepID=UPI001B3A19A0|nr:oligosaccharide flippase family protein [Flavobacterium sp. CS20]QTY26399.1 oligosaccharide flippase family protein [Flavobacterium sp. CS20]